MTGRWHFTLGSVPPSIFLICAIRSKHLTNCIVIPWKVSQPVNTSESKSAETCHDASTSSTAKATKTIGFLRRNLRSCPQAIRSQAYTTLIRPVLEYGSVVWNPYQQHLIQRLEDAQRQAARFATGDYSSRDPGSVSTMSHQLDWEPLEHRRVRNRVIMFYKIDHHIVEVPVHHLLHVTNS